MPRITRSTKATRRKLLMKHDDRVALIRKPFHITYISSEQRWGGVQIIHDDSWQLTARTLMKQAYSREHMHGLDDAMKAMEVMG